MTDIPDWHYHRYGPIDERIIAAKLAEECGEVCGAVIKLEEGRATADDLLDEIGDVLIVLTVLANRHGHKLDDLRTRRFQEVRNR